MQNKTKFFNFYFLIFIITKSELINTISYYPQRIFSTLKTGVNPHLLKTCSLIELKKLHKKQQEQQLSIVQHFFHNAKTCKNNQLLTAFLLAQQRMKLPHIITFFERSYLLEQNIATYEPMLASIVLISDNFDTLSPTLQCATLLHELRHAQQHLSGITFQLYENETQKIKKIEHDADNFAAHAMQCFVCCFLQQKSAFSEKHPLGYFSKNDYESYLQKYLKNNQLCKAHKNFTKSDLDQFNLETDFYCGQLEDRLPNKIQPLPIFAKPKI